MHIRWLRPTVHLSPVPWSPPREIPRHEVRQLRNDLPGVQLGLWEFRRVLRSHPAAQLQLRLWIVQTSIQDWRKIAKSCWEGPQGGRRPTVPLSRARLWRAIQASWASSKSPPAQALRWVREKGLSKGTQTCSCLLRNFPLRKTRDDKVVEGWGTDRGWMGNSSNLSLLFTLN